MRGKAFRRHQAVRCMWRRLREDRNEHYSNLTCACWTDRKAIARFKEQPKHCSCLMCCNARQSEGPTIGERRQFLRQFDE
jgi:hypothetical protein